ncbi:MAG TPA: hypothetical protein VKB84_26455 [Candidatus Binataceae bacterium]|nr:hypothetical protein [Candidatus Binataceae bacterium]
MTGSYWPAFDFFILILLASGMMVMACKPLTATDTVRVPNPASATAS